MGRRERRMDGRRATSQSTVIYFTNDIMRGICALATGMVAAGLRQVYTNHSVRHNHVNTASTYGLHACCIQRTALFTHLQLSLDPSGAAPMSPWPQASWPRGQAPSPGLGGEGSLLVEYITHGSP